MKKYIISIVSTVLCLMSAYADNITVADVSMSPGETQSVSINLTNTETNLVSFQMDLTLPEGITVNKSGCSLSNRFTDPDQELTIGRQPNGAIRLTSTSFNLTPISGTSGGIITLSLTASVDSEGGTATINNIRFVTSNSERITLADATFDISIASASPVITFADPAVKAICVANWDTNGDDELSEAEAAAVTDMGEVFRGNTTITSFNELQHFTGLTSLQDNAFNGCTNLTSFIIPRNVTSIGGDTFRDCKNLISISVADGNTNYDSRDNCNAIIETATNKLLLGCTNTNIPMGVTCIGVRAFQWCSFTSIDIPNSVSTIEEDAFSWCPNLTSFIIPEGVTTIAPITFYQCTSLTTITIPSSLKNVKTGAFRDCSSLSKVIVPDIAAWCGIIYEGDDWNGDFPLGRAHHLYSDENTEITEVVIPEGVTRIEARVFRDAEYITSVTIPNSVIYIGQEAFRGMRNLTSINIPNYGITSIGKDAFCDCAALTSITIPISVTSIDNNAFWNCNSLQKVIVPDIAAWCSISFYNWDANPLSYAHHLYSNEVTEIKNLIIPNGVTSIGFAAFGGCSGLNSVFIPNTVTQIKKSAFAYCSGLTSFTIQNGLTNIGDYAFYYCSSLTDAWCYAENMPTTGSSAFKNSTIATATLHVPIASLESYKATSPWSGFGRILPIIIDNTPNITFADANVKAICVAQWDLNGDDELSEAEAAIVTDLGEVFKNNTTITSFDELQYFTGLTSIQDNAFNGCTNLISLILPNGLTTIGGCAFRSTAITSLTIPASVTYIAVSADGGGLTEDCTSLMNIYVEEDNSHYYSENGVLFSEDEDIIGTNGKAILLFPQGRSGSYIIPSGVTVIAQRAFVSCKGLNSIVIPEGVTTIAGEYAFHGCSNLSCITIPSSMTNIGDGSFYNCSSISDVWCHAEAVPSTSSWAFYGSPIASATLHVPAASLEAYSTTAPWSGFGTIAPIIIDNSPVIAFADANVKALCVANWDTNGDGELSEAEAAAVTDLGEVFKGNTTITSFNELQYFTRLTRIGGVCFFGCSSLTSITIPNSVTSIGTQAFESCSSLTSITIPNSVNRINNCLFYGCSGLTSITIPNSVTSIGAQAFYGCVSLTSVTLPEDLTTIEGSAFKNSGLETIAFPNSVISIGGRAFDGCSNLTSVTMPASVITFDENDGNAFGQSNNIEAVYISDLTAWLGTSFPNANNPLRSGAKLYLNNVEVTDLVIPDGTTSIHEAAFEGCESLTSVTIPNSVTSIGGWAFASCSNLATVTIAESVTSFGNKVFRSCSSLKDFWCYAEDIPSTGNDLFLSTDIASATLHVPATSLEAYSTTAPWSGFGTIVAIDEVTSGDELYASDITRPNGCKVNIPIILENLNDYAGLQCQITLPEGVSFEKVNRTGRLTDHKLSTDHLGNNTYRVLIYTDSRTHFTGNDGALFTITVNIADDMEDGSYPIAITNIVASDADLNESFLSNSAGILTIDSTIKLGDATNDGRVNVTDILAVANYILEIPMATFNEQAADVNGDGRVNVTDLLGIVNIILPGNSNNGNSVPEMLMNEPQ